MQRQQDIDIPLLLSRVFIFASLSEKILARVTAICSIKQLDRGEMLFVDGQPARAFFIIVSGQVKIYKLAPDGNEHILHIQKQGDLLAEAIIFDFDNYPAYCQAIEPTMLIRIPKFEFLSLLKQLPDIMLKILSAYSKRIRLLIAKIEELSLYDIKARLARYLIKNATIQEGQTSCVLTLSKKDLAALLGTIPETLSRTLNYFKRNKIIAERKNNIVLLNLPVLKSYNE